MPINSAKNEHNVPLHCRYIIALYHPEEGLDNEYDSDKYLIKVFNI